MKLGDIEKRLQAPFPAHVIRWKPTRAMWTREVQVLKADIEARTIHARLDAICPNDWHFHVQPVVGADSSLVHGSLTVLGVTREDVGVGSDFRAAMEDAVKRCAVQFGIGRYLLDLPKFRGTWNSDEQVPDKVPELPQWALPDHEKSPGGSHLIQAIEQLKHELPDDNELQREIYKHLKASLQVISEAR